MDTLEALKKAIQDRIPTTFRYVREGKNPGARKGDPHAVFIKRLKSGDEHVYAHVVQSAGVTDSGQTLPSWRQFFLNDIVDVELHPDEAPFKIDDEYNPTFYEFPIAKV